MTKTDLLNTVEMMLHSAKCAGALDTAFKMELTLIVTAKPAASAAQPVPAFSKQVTLDARQIAKLAETL